MGRVSAVDVAVVSESWFGDTRSIAEAIAEGVGAAEPDARVVVLAATDASGENIGEPALVAVGGPTQLPGLSETSFRRKALQGLDDPPSDSGINDADDSGIGGSGIRDPGLDAGATKA